ncbi:MAG: c-type cytochrome, partial [Verrucomicrobiae bacterium]|nr:c-type cytochrome [Verrucomicrobiae bacterium]
QLFLTARDEDVTYASDALLNRNSGYADAFNKAAKSRPNQQQIAYAYALRVAKAGWTPALRRAFFAWFPTTAAWQGGNSFRGYLEIFRKEALANVADPAERQALEELSTRVAQLPFAEYAPPKGPGRDYSVDEVVALAADGWHDRDFADGRNLFHAMACASCHRFDGTGGSIGPDLTTASARFSLRDLADNIINPSKVISDQYGSEQVRLKDGSTLIGRAYEEGDQLYVVYDPRNPDDKETAPLSDVKERLPYPVSFMPAGLLNALNPDEVLDLLAYIQSGGDPRQPVFRQ